jgi:hypothetical protein
MQVTADKNKYLAFVLNEATRQKLIDALGERFRVRVCHHITMAHEIDQRVAERLQDLVTHGKCEFTAFGAHIGEDYATIGVQLSFIKDRSVIEGTNMVGARTIVTRIDGKRYHVTYERKEHISNRECEEILHLKKPFHFVPLDFKLEGEFQMLEKGGNTPEEVNEHFALSPKVNFKGEDWVPCGWTPEGHPMAFVLRNKLGPSRTVDMDLTPHSEYMKLYVAWKSSMTSMDEAKHMKAGLEQERARRRTTFPTRLVSPPQPAEVDPNHKGLCREVPMPGELMRCVLGMEPEMGFDGQMHEPSDFSDVKWADMRHDGTGSVVVEGSEGFFPINYVDTARGFFPAGFAERKGGVNVRVIFVTDKMFMRLLCAWCAGICCEVTTAAEAEGRAWVSIGGQKYIVDPKLSNVMKGNIASQDNLCKTMANPVFVWAEIRQNGLGIKFVVSENGFYGTKFTTDNYPIQFARRLKGKDVETIFGDHAQFDALFRDWCLANNRPIPEGYDVKKWFPPQQMASGPTDAERCQHDQWKPGRDCL